MVSLSRLFAFMYLSRLRRVLGVSWAGWFRLIPLLLFFIGLFLGWSFYFLIFWLAVFLIVLFAYMLVGRLGYKRFVPDAGYELRSGGAIAKDDQHIPLRATGVFSLNDREDYVLEHSAEYWRVPLGKHIFMVQYRPGKYLYQIIVPEHVLAVEPGLLLFGSSPKRALSLTFWVTWGPEYVEYRLYYVGADNAQTPKQQRTVYLTFADEDNLQRVWRSLTATVRAK